MFQKRRPGDRRKVWNETCAIQGGIGTLIAFMFIFAGFTNEGTTGGTIFCFAMGLIMLFMACLELLDIKRGWKIKHIRPPWADRHDEINRKHGININISEPNDEYKKTHRYICDYEKERKKRT